MAYEAVAQALIGMGSRSELYPSGRRYQRKARRVETLRAHAALEGIRGRKRLEETEQARQRAGLKQSLFGRGLGKSTIADEEIRRQAAIQQERTAGLTRQEEIAEAYIGALRARRKVQKRFKWAPVYQAAISGALSAYGESASGEGQQTSSRGGTETGGGYSYGAGYGSEGM